MSSDVSEKETIEEIIPIIENQLSVGKTSVKITPIEQLVGVNKTYRCNMETMSDTRARISIRLLGSSSLFILV